jgi:GTPase SAR1 family protein
MIAWKTLEQFSTITSRSLQMEFCHDIRSIIYMNQRLTKPTKINVVTDKEPPTRFKVIVLGDASVGKSSIVDRFLSNKFEDQYNPTIAVDYKHKSIYVNKELTLHVRRFENLAQFLGFQWTS